MSELTPCNYCTFRRIKHRAALRDWRVTKKVDKDGWTNIYVHPSNVTEFPNRYDGEPSRYFVASMMKITDHCVC